MLYDPRHVTRLQPLNEEAGERYTTFHPPKELITTVTQLKYPLSNLESMIFLISIIGKELTYDHANATRRHRTATETWNDKKGNCFEQEGLFLGILEHVTKKRHPILLIAGYTSSCTSVHDQGIHPAIGFTSTLGNHYASLTWKTCWDTPREDPNWVTMSRTVTREEFITCNLILSAEQSTNRGAPRQALKTLEQALTINPNDYTAHCERGRAERSIGNIRRSREAFEQAIAIAPRCADIHKEYGDELQQHTRQQRSSQKEILTHYQQALNLTTYDLQVLLSLEKRFRTLGEKTLSHEVRERIAKKYDEEFTRRIMKQVKDSYRLPPQPTIIVPNRQPRESLPRRWNAHDPERRAQLSNIGVYEGPRRRLRRTAAVIEA